VRSALLRQPGGFEGVGMIHVSDEPRHLAVTHVERVRPPGPSLDLPDIHSACLSLPRVAKRDQDALVVELV